ncbi:MAG: ABC transporter permease, partial [Bryobacteraceae bacterium]
EPALLDVQKRSQSLTAVAGYRRGAWALTGAGEPESIQAAAVIPSFFAMFGIKPITGAVFHDSRPYVVISPSLWKRKWRMNPLVVGRTIALDGEAYTVAGVADMPDDLLPGVELLLPLAPKATESRTAHEIDVVARIRDGVGERQAQAELSKVAAGIARDHPKSDVGWGMRAVPLADYVLGPATVRMIWMIFAAVALLWLLACANVAGLQIARSIARKHEMSTRLALGASRSRIIAQTLTESLVLAFGGAILGTLIAQFALDAIRRFAIESMPRMAAVHIDGATIGIALGCMLISTLLFGMLSGKTPVSRGEREVSRRDRGRDALIMTQVALASVLLLGATLLFHSFLHLRAVDPGFDPERLLTVGVNLSGPGYDDSRRASFFRDVTERLTRLPGVESAGATNIAPFSGQGTANRFRVEGDPASTEFRSAAWRAVTPGFFATLGVPLKRGRLFTDADTNGSPEVVILSESMAKRFWPNRDPIGQRLLWGSSMHPKTIVGIVGDLRDMAVDSPPAPTMFRPFAQLSDAPMSLVIRTNGNPTAEIMNIRRAIWAVDRNAALDFQPLSQAMSDSILRPRASLLAVAAFALVAMITAAFGLYGSVSYRVSRRQQEIGIRLALGAPAGSVRWGIQKACMVLVGFGLAIGLPCAYVLSTLMKSLLYETQRLQPDAYAMVLVVFLAVALAASYGPARRASRMDPLAAIRHE